MRRSTSSAIALATVLLVGACKGDTSKKQESPGEGAVPAAPATPTAPAPVKRLSEDLRPGPRNAERARIAIHLETCLLGSAPPAVGCYTDTVRARLVGARDVSASGRDAVVALHAGGFGLGLKDVGYKPILTMVKGAEALLVFHLAGTTDGELPGAKPEPKTGAKPVALVGAVYVRYDKSDAIVEWQAHLDRLSALGQTAGSELAFRPPAPAHDAEPIRRLASGFGSEAKNVALLQHLADDLDQHDPKLMARYYTADATLWRAWRPDESRGIEAIMAAYASEYAGSTDSDYTLQWKWVAMDHVVVQLERSGTHTGPLFGSDKPGKRSYTVRELHVMRVEEGAFAEHRIFLDDLDLAGQIGVR
jgi:hypothetical protein